MENRTLTPQLIIHELEFTTSRSSGPGGQNVNKVNSKVTLRWDVKNSGVITQEQKDILLQKLSTKLSTEGVLIISSQEKRSQVDNKEEAIRKLEQLLRQAFTVRKKRKATKPSKGAKQNRLDKKKKHSDKKKLRQNKF